MPVLFVGHGSPMNLMLDNAFTRDLTALGRNLPRPRAIMVISAHWLTNGSFVSGVKKPRMIYDFYGFSRSLYHLVYECPGAPQYAQAAADLSLAKDKISLDFQWGLDHGAYSVLKHLFPAADIPVFEMSLNYSFNAWVPHCVSRHYELGRRLLKLRRMGVLIIGSGNVVHNLDRIDSDMDAQPYIWADQIDQVIKDKLLKRDDAFLVDFPTRDKKTSSLAAPTLDHYLPMIYALALGEKGETLRFVHESIQNGSISMRSFIIE
ncbi:MAG: 4,5-DOPA dioxygenase extradiol [Candidatus Omnitrophica bacterium]|nr:4,5-DOPA dioxygenase extradiol [Candidatus Omnitrophota bacterium]